MDFWLSFFFFCCFGSTCTPPCPQTELSLPSPNLIYIFPNSRLTKTNVIMLFFPPPEHHVKIPTDKKQSCCQTNRIEFGDTQASKSEVPETLWLSVSPTSIWSGNVVKIPPDGERGAAATRAGGWGGENTLTKAAPPVINGQRKTAKCDRAAEGKRLIHLKQI